MNECSIKKEFSQWTYLWLHELHINVHTNTHTHTHTHTILHEFFHCLRSGTSVIDLTLDVFAEASDLSQTGVLRRMFVKSAFAYDGR
jgi:hypothetical protein